MSWPGGPRPDLPKLAHHRPLYAYGIPNFVDLLIAAATLIGLANGYRRGFWLSMTQYLGLLAGVLLGAIAAEPLLDYIRVTSPVARPLGAVLVLIIGGSLGSSIGYAAGEPIRKRILRGGRHAGDSLGGAAFSALAVLLMMWFVGLSFSRGPSQEVAHQIQGSVVLHQLDSIAPQRPAFLARVEDILAGVQFPAVFAGLEPSLPASLPVPPPASVNTPGVNHAAQSVFKVTSLGCGGLVTGSGFAIGGGYVVTNAHVVSGTHAHRVQTPGGEDLPATVVYFDPARDFALLSVPNLTSLGLGLAPASRGMDSAVIGYPGGGAERIEPAVVDGAVEAVGRDIFSDNSVTRQVYVIQGRVRPGNSGGPLVDLKGKVLGIVFATSASDPNQAYALTDDEISADLNDVRGRHTIDTSRYQCAA